MSDSSREDYRELGLLSSISVGGATNNRAVLRDMKHARRAFAGFPLFSHYPQFLNRSLSRPGIRGGARRVCSGGYRSPVAYCVTRGNLTYNTDMWAEKEDPLPFSRVPTKIVAKMPPDTAGRLLRSFPL